MVEHFHVDFFESFYSVPREEPCQAHFNRRDSTIISEEIDKLLKIGVIKQVNYEPGQFISPIFVRPKGSSGEYRMILNLSHFKMDTFEKTLALISRNTFMGSIDLRLAYYSVSIAEEQQKYFRFYWQGNLYQFTACPNELACMPRMFTKLLKPVYARLRSEGHVNSGFIDDSLLCGDSFSQCFENIADTKTLMEKVGFVINFKKSVLIPTKRIVFLGNIIDEQMKVFLPEDKKEKIKLACRSLRAKCYASIRHVAEVIGLLVAAFSAVQFGQLYYRNLEKSKSVALALHKGDFDQKMVITDCMKSELDWWINHIGDQYRLISHGNPTKSVETDASLIGWGAVFEDSVIGSRWSDLETTEHINSLELKAVLLALTAYSSKSVGQHVQILLDSSTAVAYITHMGGIRSENCNALAKEIWFWCIKNNIWLSAAHIAGKRNLADSPSRQFNDRIEWSLTTSVFHDLCKKFGKPDIDLFASMLNTKLPQFCSWKPDPNSSYVDAFTLDWKVLNLLMCFLLSVCWDNVCRKLQKTRRIV